MTRRLAFLVVIAGLASCQCQRGPVDPVQLGLRVDPAELDFGRVLEGSVAKANLTLTAQTRAPVSLALSTEAPFGAPATAEVPGGGDTTVVVTFRAGSEAVEGVLSLTVGDLTAQVKLKGVGVRPPECRPSAECVVSAYSLEADRCLETQAADDAPCDPSSVCLEQGRCRAGQCLGIARRCDDNDACTDDACAMDLGCIHTPHACPSPNVACQVATCDARAGCGVGPALDSSSCGPGDCTEVNFCFQGTCRQLPTPEGQPCSPAVACLPEGHCHEQKCTRPSEADWSPTWSARLPGTPTGGLASAGPTLYFSLCLDSSPDAGEVDAGDPDAGSPDAGPNDAGLSLVCGLASYTGTGFERFVRAYEDASPRRVLAVSGDRVVLQRDGGVELRATSSGELRGGFEFDGPRTSLALSRDTLYFVHDGGLQAFTDGGLRWLAAAEGELARGDALYAWSADAGVLTRFELLDDGGLTQLSVTVPGLPAPIAVAGSSVVIGSVGRVAIGGGLVPFDWSGAGATRFYEDQTLVSPLVTDVFFERCVGGCAQVVRAYATQTGLLVWEAPMILASTPGTIVSSTLIEPVSGGVASLVRLDTLAGPRAELRMMIDGGVVGLCRLPEGSGAIEQAVFSSTAMVVTSRRADGGLVLESYELGALSPSRAGWPTVNGVGGTRSDRP